MQGKGKSIFGFPRKILGTGSTFRVNTRAKVYSNVLPSQWDRTPKSFTPIVKQVELRNLRSTGLWHQRGGDSRTITPRSVPPATGATDLSGAFKTLWGSLPNGSTLSWGTKWSGAKFQAPHPCTAGLCNSLSELQKEKNTPGVWIYLATPVKNL